MDTFNYSSDVLATILEGRVYNYDSNYSKYFLLIIDGYAAMEDFVAI